MTIDLDALRSLLAEEPDVQLAILFGSLATWRATAGSDLDLAISTGGEMSSERRQELSDRLAGLVGRPIDLIDLATSGGALHGQILRTGTIVIETVPGVLGRLHERFLDWQADLAPAVESLLRTRRARLLSIGHG